MYPVWCMLVSPFLLWKLNFWKILLQIKTYSLPSTIKTGSHLVTKRRNFPIKRPTTSSQSHSKLLSTKSNWKTQDKSLRLRCKKNSFKRKKMTKLSIFLIKNSRKKSPIVHTSMSIEIYFQTLFIRFCLTFKGKTNPKISSPS